MDNFFCSILKTQLDELFSDLLRLPSLNTKQKSLIMFIKTFIDNTQIEKIMKILTDEIVNVDLEELEKDNKLLFKYILECASKNNISENITNDVINDIYLNLSEQNKKVILDYSRSIKRICEKWKESQ